MSDLFPVVVLAASVLVLASFSLKLHWEAEYYRRQCERLRDELADLHLKQNRENNLQDREGEEWRDN
jgi:hypothetical protein